MDQTLTDFYRQDASLRKLPQDDQQRLFAEWAARKNIQGKLEFGTPRWIKHARLGAILFLGLYLIAFIREAPGLARVAFPFVLILIPLLLGFGNQMPILTQAQQASAGQPEKRSAPIDSPDKNPYFLLVAALFFFGRQASDVRLKKSEDN